MPASKFFKKAISVSLCSLLFVGNCLLAHSAESNFWNERRQKVELAFNPLIQLPPPKAVPPPQFESQKFSGSNIGVSNYWGPAPARDVLHNWDLRFLKYGSIRKVLNPKFETALSKSKKLIFHIQDIHRNPEAQSNIEKTVQLLINNRKVDLVALEGASGELNFKTFHAFPDQKIIEKIADHLLQQNDISGPAHAGMTNAS